MKKTLHKLLFFSLLLCATMVNATTLMVTNSDNDGENSLRDIIANANDGDSITFDTDITFIILESQISFGQTNITIDGGGIVTISGDESESFRLLNSTAVSGTLTLNGLTIENGNLTGDNQHGGAVYIAGNAILTNCTFVNNTAGENGGAVYAARNITLVDCTFADNTSNGFGANHGGGAIFANNTIEAENCIFTNNTANFGGAIYTSTNAALTLNNCTFSENMVNYSGGAMFLRNIATITGCAFIENTADVFGGVLFATASPLLMITNCTMHENITGSGGSCAIESGVKTYLFHSTITNNKGGGIFAAGGKSAYLYNCIVAGNTNNAGTALLQTNVSGNGIVQNAGSLIEGENDVTYWKIFGLNTETDGIYQVLGNGIAAGTATAISEEIISEIADFNVDQQTAIITALATDQIGDVRAATGNVTYGAVEISANALESVEVKGGTSVRIIYELNEMPLDFTNGKLTLIYSNGTEEIDMTAEGVTNDADEDITATAGSKEIKFTYFGLTTDVGLFITVKDDEVTGNCSTFLDAPTHLTVYPNPTRGELTINALTGSANKIEVFNLQGKLVLQLTTNPFDISALLEGIYMIRVNGEMVKVVKK